MIKMETKKLQNILPQKLEEAKTHLYLINLTNKYTVAVGYL
jgi:hypothetical protein